MLFVLAKFDVRVGNQLVWTSEPIDSTELPGVEFKMIPSGLHDRAKETIYFGCGSYHGVARYEARVRGSAREPGSALIYALGALVPMSEDLPWGQEPFLAMELRKFLDLGASIDPHSLSLPALPAKPLRPDPRSHPILASALFLQVYGPLVFELWKMGLARSRTLLAPLPNQSIRAMCQFTYIAAQISSIPADVVELMPHDSPLTGPIRPLYNVAVSDLQRLQSAESFWATTTDMLLLSPSRDACDAYVNEAGLHDLTSGAAPQQSTPTWRDRRRFALLVDALNLPGVSFTNGWGEVLVDAVANGLVWWASAGESVNLDRDETAPLLNPAPGLAVSHATELGGHGSTSLDSTSDVVALVGQFQQYTRQFVQIFAKLAEDDDLAVRVSFQDIVAMGLDPLAQSDRDFIKRFSLAWWDRPVVFGRFCC